VHISEISHFGHAAIVLGRHLLDRRKDGDHCVVDPNVNRTEFTFDGRGRFLDGRGVRDVQRHNERPPAGSLDLASGRLQSVAAAGQQSDAGLILGKLADHGASDPSRRPGHHHHFGLAHRFHSVGRSE